MLKRVLIAKAYEDGYSKELTLVIENGVVIKRHNYVYKEICKEYECIDLRDSGILVPGFIDMHVHLRGLKLSYKEDEESGTKAAAHGGFTAVIDMPNTVPRIDNTYALDLKLSMLKTKSYVDYGVYISPPNDKDVLMRMLVSEGVVGVKIFPQDLYKVPLVIDALKDMSVRDDRKRIVIVHAENPLMINDCDAGHRYICRPIESEVSVLNILKDYAEPGIHIHVTHVTNVLTLTLAKNYGFTVDTCPHYLYLDSDYEKDLGCIAKVNPPLRSHLTRVILLNYIKMFDAVTSDHAPHSVEEKEVSFLECPSGISSIDIIGSLILNLVSRGVMDLDDAITLMSRGPARLLRLYRWGCLYEGCIASYTVVDLNSEVSADPQYFFSKAKLTPYRAIKLRGSVKATIVRGYLVYKDNDIVEKPDATPITMFMR